MSTITDSCSSNKNGVANRRRLAFTAGIGAALAVFFAAGTASADNPSCANPLAEATPPPTIYGTGGSATKPLLGKVAAAIRASTTAPVNVVYQQASACTGINDLIGTGGVPTNIVGSASYFTTDGVEHTCDLTATVGDPVDFASMGNTAPSCPGVTALPADVGDVAGPVDSYDLIVPNASSQTVISSEAAYFVFGFGMAGQAAPWLDDTQIFVRDQNSAAQLFISLATGVPASKFKGVNTLSNSGTVTAVAGAAKPEAAIGLVSGEVADAARSTVRALAYQHVGQRCGFTPDSTSTSFDKKNVRNGQYHIWAPVHFFGKIDATTKKIANPAVAAYLGLFSGDNVDPAVDILNIEIKAGNIPRCAMNVWRDTDLGPISKNVPAAPCSCYFDSIATGTSTCSTCTIDNDCPNSAPKCRRNFCEAR